MSETESGIMSPPSPVSISKPALVSSGVTATTRGGAVVIVTHHGATTITVTLSPDESRALGIALAQMAMNIDGRPPEG